MKDIITLDNSIFGFFADIPCKPLRSSQEIKFETDEEGTTARVVRSRGRQAWEFADLFIDLSHRSRHRAHGAPSDATEAVSRSSPRSYRLLSHARRGFVGRTGREIPSSLVSTPSPGDITTCVRKTRYQTDAGSPAFCLHSVHVTPRQQWADHFFL